MLFLHINVLLIPPVLSNLYLKYTKLISVASLKFCLLMQIAPPTNRVMF